MKMAASNGGRYQPVIHLKDSQPQLFIYTFDSVHKTPLYAPNCSSGSSLLDTNVVVNPHIQYTQLSDWPQVIHKDEKSS